MKKLEKLASNMEQPATVTEIAEEEMDQDNYFLYPVSIEDGLDQDNSFLDSVSHVKHVQPAQCTQR
ncbi:hypothetical protein [Wolbachia endosymbiont of Ctenocephalides felis wCfeT]|uniref:hypothetical protein n=1 Tax=Wolbachia endosymbiont of Ctenocephalides felis wCfeT TaxID=2732593 RepID=UPI00144631E3|nr:hypothetical protein [Wolbachia endosymbiont of Ctenocephalides felis wCfeT]